ncbi:GNAT family N-acetyltransferase [Pararobbsia silviterrae]|uniref:GNAT family N-acetyltransferase n=1 Tax=Pararobbsia silviterrae TaxID=1792498 RepID=A0A494XDE4_9BURK|nr:GNAT family N-acetyltransferase [Pararobbsia silviterrae]RKP46154.1 GNAT family N-acetyltransferase [Pararobbsia silviterrae]
MTQIRPMTLHDYDAVIALMKQTPGVSVRDADSRDAVGRYLERNPGLSFVACADEADGIVGTQAAHRAIVGCIMSGHDGRRGYLQHLVVHPDHRRRGLGGALATHCIDALAALGIHKCHVDVLKNNASGADFWTRQGWSLRTDIDRYSHIRGGNANA